jgi:preprotein translocase subunit YajC
MLFAASHTKSGGSSLFTFLILAVLVGLFYLLIMRPQRNRQRKAMQTQNQVVPGQRVRTTAGMYGTVVSGDERDVVIEVAPGVQITMLRRAIMDVVNDADTGDAMPSHEDLGAEEPAADTGSGTQDGQVSSSDFDNLKDRNV